MAINKQKLKVVDNVTAQPVKDFLSGLEWNKQDHIRQLASHFQETGGYATAFKTTVAAKKPSYKYLGSEVFYLWLLRWLSGAVGKVLDGRPGPLLILDGSSKIGKSHFVRWLGGVLPDHFIESPIDPQDKDHRLLLMSNLVWEVQNLAAVAGRWSYCEALLENFVKASTVTVKKPRTRYITTGPATASLIGTVNQGGQAFLARHPGCQWLLICQLKDINWAYAGKIDPHQVWAQAVALYLSGQIPPPEEGERRLQQLITEQYIIQEPQKDIEVSEVGHLKGRHLTLAHVTEDGGPGSKDLITVQQLKSTSPQSMVLNEAEAYELHRLLSRQLYAPWGNDGLESRIITALRPMNEAERQALNWPEAAPIVIKLDDGKLLFASTDDEGNGAGSMWLRDKGGKIYTLETKG